MLRCGAYDIFTEEKSGSAEKESNDFIEQDIDSILARRTKTVIHENTGSQSNAAGGTFSKASFTSKATSATPGKDIDIDDPDFWTKMVGAPVTGDDDNILKSTKKKRQRTKAVYNERSMHRTLDEHIIMKYGDSDSEDDLDGYSSSSSEESETFDVDQACEYNLNSEVPLHNKLLLRLLNTKKKENALSERRRWGGSKLDEWPQSHVEMILDLLLKYGYCKEKGWKVFLEQFQNVCKKEYNEEEVSIWLTLVEIPDMQSYVIFVG